MIGAPFSFYIAFLGLIGGFVFGFVARRGNFCTLGAIEETYYGTERSRLRTWVLAVGVAIAGTQLLDLAGIIDLKQSFYLAPQIRILGSVLGGMLFGLGMALVGTCAFGMLVRAGGGDMRALVSVLILAIVGYATANGILAYVGLYVIIPSNIELSQASTSAITELWFGPSRSAQVIVAGVVSLGAIAWAVSSPRFVKDGWALLAGLAIGLVIVYGWWVTGTIGQGGFESVQFESYRFARPMGDTLVYLMTFSGAAITFPVGGVFGVLLGAFVAAKMNGCFRFEAFDDAREMRRHFGGAALMGIGAIFATGCTVGQGMSGISTLSVNAFMTIASIAFSAWLGIRYLIEGEIPSLKDMVMQLFHRS
jgi:uncharacterized membrane protein YedE/YeeE